MKTLTSVLLMVFSASIFATESNKDWRNTASSEIKIDNLIKVIPSASVIMQQMGERYKNLYWAAKQEKWEFAEYQMEEMEELINMLIITRPNRAETAREFKSVVFDVMPKAIATYKWDNFINAFDVLRNQCMGCHAKNDHAFITLPVPKSANSPVLGMR